jgi:hypothetical protein
MAVVTSFALGSHEARRLHPTSVECQCSVVTAPDGRRYLQLDTHGSMDREIPGKLSQTIQFDAAVAQQLRAILDEVFPA